MSELAQWYQDWKEQNQDKWFVKSDTWAACSEFHERLATAAKANFPDELAKESETSLSYEVLEKMYGIK